MSGQNYFFPGPPDPSFYEFLVSKETVVTSFYGYYNGNAEYERQFLRNAYDWDRLAAPIQ